MIMIKFTAQGANSAVGGFNHGDIMRIGDALAKHLVEDAKVAVYVESTPLSEDEKTVAKPARKSAAKK